MCDCFTSLYKRGVELLCITSVVIAIILFSLGESMYDKSDNQASKSNEHDEYIGFIIILVSYGFLCISLLFCCFLVIKQVRISKPLQISTQNDLNYLTFDNT